MGGHAFVVDLRILRLGGCHIVLGVDWMRTVSPLVFDFNTLEVTFDTGGHKITLKGCQQTGECKEVSGKRLYHRFFLRPLFGLGFALQSFEMTSL